jgi:hypothetical protein
MRLALFNVSGLASAAIEANQYCIAWHLHIPRDGLAEETRQFVQWQQAFQKRCAALGVLENVRYTDWQLELIKTDALKPISMSLLAAFHLQGLTKPHRKKHVCVIC